MSTHPAIDLLLVDDDEEFRNVAARCFSRHGYRVQEAPDGLAAISLAQQRQFDVAILDMRMPGMSGLELLQKLKTTTPECECIILTGEGTIETAVQSMKQGAYDYLTKPFSLGDLEVVVQKAYERRRLDKENTQLKAVLQRSQPAVNMIGQGPRMQEVFRLIERAGPTDKAILILGESGTGKELVARGLHRASSRSDRPLVVINCAALTETLLESELFGYEKGAFTGAVATKQGLFEVADGGTLFIDEIGEMPGSLQAKLLRVLEDGSMRRVGSVKERRVDVRLIAATNRNLADEVREGRFREDLFYRINVMALELPPLRYRKEDLPLLVNHFLGDQWQVEPEARELLYAYSWPGNVRQLINVIDRAKILADPPLIRVRDLPHELTAQAPAPGEVMRAGLGQAAAFSPVGVGVERLADVQKAHILEVLKKEGGNKARAARSLGVNRRSLYRLLEKYDLRNV